MQNEQRGQGSIPLRAVSRHGASFSLSNKLFRLLWSTTWLLLARYTPAPLHPWRRFLLRLFGAQVGGKARVYGTCTVWSPRNLALGAGSVMGPRVRCYNQGHITIGEDVVVSQDASLVASTHDVRDPLFPLVIRPITIQDHAWIAAEAFVGPGVVVREGAVLGARAVAMVELAPWTFYTGNPAQPLKPRPRTTRNRLPLEPLTA